MNLNKILIILTIAFIILFEAYICIWPTNYEEGSDGISYYNGLKNDTSTPIAAKHPLFILMKPLASLPIDDFMIILRWIPAFMFNLALFLLFGLTPWLGLSLITMVIVSNPATAEMVSIVFFCIAYSFRKEWKAVPFAILSFFAHRFGVAWSALYFVSSLLVRFKTTEIMRITAVPLAIIWACIALYFVKYGLISPGFLYELSVFAAFFLPLMTYFMLRSKSQENVCFVWITIFLSLPLIYCLYVSVDNIPQLFKNIYNEYVRITIMGLAPIMIFFLAEEKHKLVLNGYIMLIIVNASMNILGLAHIIPLQLLRTLQCITAVCFFMAWGWMYLQMIYSKMFPKLLPDIGYDP